jgi:hypothetical protein
MESQYSGNSFLLSAVPLRFRIFRFFAGSMFQSCRAPAALDSPVLSTNTPGQFDISLNIASGENAGAWGNHLWQRECTIVQMYLTLILIPIRRHPARMTVFPLTIFWKREDLPWSSGLPI